MTKISVKFDIEIENIDKFIDYMEKSIPRAFDESMVESLDKGRRFAKDVAKGHVPVDTGALKKSIREIPIKKESNDIYTSGISAGGYIRNPKTNKLVDYQWRVEGEGITGLSDLAWTTEYGSSSSRPQPYMRPSIMSAWRRLGSFFRDSILRRLEKG